MKRKVGLFLAAMLMTTSLAGCSSEQASYVQELTKVSKLESLESEIKGSVKVKVPVMEAVETQAQQTSTQATTPEVKYETVNVTFDGKGYTLNSKDQGSKAFVTLNMKSDENVLDIKDVKIYVDQDKVYISKNYFEGIMKASGTELPESLKTVKQEYVLLDSSVSATDASSSPEYQAMENYIKAVTAPEKKDEMMANLTKAMNKIDFDIPVVKSDRTYTISLTSDQIIDKTTKSMDNIVNNAEELVNLLGLKDIAKLTKEDYAELKKAYNETGKAEMTSGMNIAKEMLKGSSITTKETFGDNSYVMDFNLKLVAKDMMEMEMKMNETSKVVEKRTITLPKAENSINFEKYMEMMMPEETAVTPAA